jgi:hypothetical protein
MRLYPCLQPPRGSQVIALILQCGPDCVMIVDDQDACCTAVHRPAVASSSVGAVVTGGIRPPLPEPAISP